MNWQPYKPTDAQPWNLLRVWTLHRRTGFAATWNELQRDLADGPQKTISRILNGKARTDGVPEDFTEMRVTLGDSAVSSSRHERLIAWWIYQMCFSPDALGERLALMWHNHFATSNAKVDNLQLMREQNDIFREHGLDKFQSLLAATLKHGAMLKWLDGDENRAGKANENLGRETMELFTLGVGNYTEQDVKNASRALTGWSVFQNKFRLREDWHDDGEKTMLGKSGNFTGDDLIAITTDHPATAKRLAWRICSEFMAPSLITDKSVDDLASHLTASKLDIRDAMETLIGSNLFFSDENIKGRIVDPESFVVGISRSMELFDPPSSTMVLGDWNEQLGRKLFYPPNVGGWPGGRAWLNSRTTIARANFGVALVKGQLNRSGRAADLVALAEKHINNTEPAGLTGFYCELLTGSKQEDRTKELLSKASENTTGQNEIANNLVTLILASPAAQLA